MSGPTGATGPAGIEGIYGLQGLVGPQGVAGNKGPDASYGIRVMQCQTFSRGGETSMSQTEGLYVRPVFSSPKPELLNGTSATITGMTPTTNADLLVPTGTYLIQAANIGVTASGGFKFTCALAIRDVSTIASNVLLGTATRNNAMTFLDGIVTFTSNTTVRLVLYAGTTATLVVPFTTTGNSCMISFIKIQ